MSSITEIPAHELPPHPPFFYYICCLNEELINTMKLVEKIGGRRMEVGQNKRQEEPGIIVLRNFVLHLVVSTSIFYNPLQPE